MKKEDIPVVILCGGRGTRLREETEYKPKPMVEIGEKPILWHIMKIYSFYGFNKFILCLGYKGWIIKEYFLQYREFMSDFTLHMCDGRKQFHNDLGLENWKVTLAETGYDTYTGYRVYKIKDYINTPLFMLTYGDGVGDINIDKLLEYHYKMGKIATVTGVHPTSRYGEIELKNGLAVEFNEKPTVKEGVVSGGFFVFNKEFFDYLSDDPKLYFEEEPLRRLAREGELAVYLHEGCWYSMDTYRDYLFLNSLWKSGKARWNVWERKKVEVDTT